MSTYIPFEYEENQDLKKIQIQVPDKKELDKIFESNNQSKNPDWFLTATENFLEEVPGIVEFELAAGLKVASILN